ncbi:hypothetical protein NQ318_015776 [Aromia moschata]|uniref:Uncharacterized protein n=1 Tax=Aromia moschata TaxID=1265417 RepID=A0AAV8XPU5_9CUCU|nr:hypothetical protein NQ318_015776 [Aromia moschata]
MILQQFFVIPTVLFHIFDSMKGDNIYLQSKKDLLIVHFGNSYLKKHKREGLRYACSNRMRELSRLLISVRKMMENENMALKDILHPKYFDNVISPVRNIEGYDAFKKSFKGPSLAMHLGTSLKLIYNELIHLILKKSQGFRCHSVVERKHDIKKFREETLNIANTSKELFFNNNDNDSIYKDLIQCVLSLLIVFNRRRVGDVPFLKLSEYQRDTNHTFTDFDSVLTNTEKILTEKYKRVLTSGKGSRAVVILIPKVIQDFIDIDIISENSQVFPEDFLPL